MVDTIGEVNIGVNYVADDKSIKKATDKLLKARSGLHESLVSDLQNVLYSRYMKTGKASTGLRAGILFKKEFGLELSKYQESLLQSAGGLAMERKGFVSRAEKSYLKQQERLEKQRIAQEEKNRKQQEVNENRKIKEQERLEKQKESEENYLRRQVASKSNMFEWLDFDYAEAKKKRMGSSDFAKMQLKTKQSLHSVEELLKQIEKTDLKDTKEVQNLRKNFDKYSKISLKSQKELGIKTPSMLSQLKPLLSKLGLGWLGGPTAILGALGLYAWKQGKDVEKGIQQTAKEYQSYQETEIDVGQARAFAKSYGLTEEEGINLAKYVADFRARTKLGEVSDKEYMLLSQLPGFASAIYGKANLSDVMATLVSDVRGISGDVDRFAYVRQLLKGTPISSNILATRKEFMTPYLKDVLRSAESERAGFEIQNIPTEIQNQANATLRKYVAQTVLGRGAYGIKTGINRAVGTVTNPLAKSLSAENISNTNTTNRNVSVGTVNVTVQSDGTDGKSQGQQAGLGFVDVIKTMFIGNGEQR